MNDLSDDLRLALQLADLADEITLRRFGAADLVVETKPDLTPVSEADRAVEQALRAALADTAPADAVVGEEYGERDAGGASRRWIVDPIDGTKGYVRGVPVWATLLALQVDEETVLGVVSAPAMGRRWWAADGQGAWTVDHRQASPRRLAVSGVSRLADAQLCFGGFEEWRAADRLGALLELSGRCWRTRGFGDFWSYMLVAEGAAEIALDPAVSLWDLAAPMAVVQAAGGRFTDLSGMPTPAGGDALATNGRLHADALAVIGR
jgi:histidinol-phosphatase